MRSKLVVLLWLKRLVRYLVVPLAMCVILFPIYGLTQQQTERAQLADASEQLAAAVNTFEDIVSDLRFTTNRLFNDDMYKLLAASDDSTVTGSSAKYYAASSLMQNLAYNMSYASYIYATFSRNRCVVDPYRFFKDFDSFYPNAVEYSGVSAEEWVEWMRTEEMLCLPAQTVALNRTSYPDRYLTLCQPYIPASGQVRGACTVLIQEKQLRKLFLPMEKWREEGILFLRRDDGEVLLRSRYEGSGQIFLNKETGTDWYEGEKYLYVSRHVPALQADAVIALPYSVYGENMRAVTRAVWLYIGTGLAGCLVLSALMTLSDMRQLRPILDLLDGSGATNNQLFTEWIVQRLHNHGQLTEELERVRGELEHSRVETMLMTGFSGTEQGQKALRVLIGLTEHNYLLLLPKNADTADMGEELHLMLLDEQVRLCYGREQFVFQTTGGSKLVILTLETGDEAQQVRMCRQTEELYTRLALTEPVILSGCFSRMEELSSVYWQARNMQRYADPTQKVCYLNGESLVRMATPDVVSLERLNGYLLAGRVEDAQTLVRDLFSVETLSPQNFQQAFFSVRGVLLDAAQKVGGEEAGRLCSYDSRQLAHKQVQDLCDCCMEICSSAELLQRSHNEQLQRDILAWMGEQYTRPDLNLAMAAERFHISKKYVTQFLKDQTGKSFTEYVEDLRLTHAMELLRDTERSVTEIALACGFSAQNTFYKAFRRKFGVAPSAVRHGIR